MGGTDPEFARRARCPILRTDGLMDEGAEMPDLPESRLDEAYRLWLCTGWNDQYCLTPDEFRRSWAASPVKKYLVLHDQIVAIGRANSDGVLYSIIHDIVVDPDHRQRGFGRRIVQELLAELQRLGIRSIQLMAAKGQTSFYEKLGFVVRPPDGPGMQYAAAGMARTETRC